MFDEFRDNLTTISKRIDNIGVFVAEKANEDKEVLLALNKDQLLYGRNNEGSPLTPSYLQDPYFTTPNKAERYAKYKQSLEGYHRSKLSGISQLFPDKDKDTPNLIITGAFQDGMYIQISGTNIMINSTFMGTSSIQSKYKNKVFGLAAVSIEWYFNNILGNKINKYLFG